MKPLIHTCSIWVLALAVFPVPCLGKREQPPPDPKFTSIGEIVILPALDFRADKEHKAPLKDMRKEARAILKHKNYAVSESDTTGDVGEILREDLKTSKPEWVKRLGPKEARWVMVLGLGYMDSKLDIGSSGTAQVFGYIYDKETGETVWNDKTMGRSSAPAGLLGMSMKHLMSGAAVQEAVMNLLFEIPKKGK